jgi:hypothetical protein
MDATHCLVSLQELIDTGSQVGVATAGFVQESGPLIWCTLQGSQKYRPGLGFNSGHGILTDAVPLLISATWPGEFSQDYQKISRR